MLIYFTSAVIFVWKLAPLRDLVTITFDVIFIFAMIQEFAGSKVMQPMMLNDN